MKNLWVLQSQAQTGNCDWKFFKVCFTRKNAIEEKKWFTTHKSNCCGSLEFKYRIKHYVLCDRGMSIRSWRE